MFVRWIITVVSVAAMAASAVAQPRKASFRSGGDPNRGKCTVEVVVDGAAEVEIRGDTANLRNLSGQTPQWRRFECNGPMPPNPADFRFAGVDGRGRQTLVQDPRNGGVAIVRIEDPQNGSEGYTFDIFWANGFDGGNRTQGYPPPQRQPDSRDYGRRDPDAYYRDRDTYFRGENWRGQLFQRVRQDVEYLQSVTYPGGGDQWRLARTLQELDELQGKLAAGRFDEQELDEVMGALRRVVQDNRLSQRDRTLLADDLDRLREFRARHDEYGARAFDGGVGGGGGRDPDAYHRDRDDRFRGENGRAQFFQRIREDLDHVRAETFPMGGDQFRLARTLQELDELQSKLAAGRYDERQVDDVIGAMQRVVQDNRMSGRDRDVLSDDLNRLRDFRARHDSYGAR